MFKNIFVYIFVLMFSVCPLLAWQGGSGTEADPFQIWTKADLEALSDSVSNIFGWSSNKYFKLMADITEPVTQTIGGKPYDIFRGHFNGNKKTITVAIYNNNQYYGLFNSTSEDAVIENLDVAGEVIIDNDNSDFKGIGGIVCINHGTVQNCNNYAPIKSAYQVGGISVSNAIDDKLSTRGEIINCANYGDLEAYARTSAVGGISSNNVSYISSCLNAGNIKWSGKNATFVYAGGIIGVNGSYLNMNNQSTVVLEYCTNIGKVESNVAGGISGCSGSQNKDEYFFKNINYGFVHGDNIAGGIVGENRPPEGSTYNTIISNCLNTGVVSGNNNVGCLIGSDGIAKDKITITDCYFDKQMCPYGGIGGK